METREYTSRYVIAVKKGEFSDVIICASQRKDGFFQEYGINDITERYELEEWVNQYAGKENRIIRLK